VSRTKPDIVILGDEPFAVDAKGKLKSRIATAFPRHNTLVTLPGVHMTQRQAFLELLEEKRRADGKPPLTRRERDEEWERAVDLIVEGQSIQIRPDPADMQLAFHADDLLQRIVPKWRIRFLGVLNRRVQGAIKRRGELWRITPLPKTPEEMNAMIAGARIGIGGKDIYYYSPTTGVRYLTCQEFENLGQLDDEELRRHLEEIRIYLGRTNAAGYPELAFFPPGVRIPRLAIARRDFLAMEPAEVRAAWAQFRDLLNGQVKPDLRHDDLANPAWKNQLVAALVGREDELAAEDTLLGLGPEFFMQIEWLPGGRIEEGELVFDPALDEAAGETDPLVQRLLDEKPRKFIFNFVREYGDLEHVNVGRVIGSLSHRPAGPGRRGVYVAVVKQRQSAEEIVSIIRMQKQGVREYLDEGSTLMDAMVRAEEYTEYILDRRLGCRQLGMNLPLRVTARRISERYDTHDGGAFPIWTPYFEREYIRGTATDKIPARRYESEDFCLGLARLLGAAAAPNMVVGRCDSMGQPLFDDGDEVVMIDDRGLPADIIVSDPTGCFNDYASPLAEFTVNYAFPVTRRRAMLARVDAFADAYLNAFLAGFQHIQGEYRRRRKGFDSLFGHLPDQKEGSFPYRWRRVLARLDETSVGELVVLMRGNIARSASAQ
jgi:hypothetical protein